VDNDGVITLIISQLGSLGLNVLVAFYTW